MEAEITGKVCTKCGIYKSLDEYYRQAHGPFGRKSKCKSCIAAYDATRAALKEERAKKRRETDPDAMERYKASYKRKNARKGKRVNSVEINRRNNLRRYGITLEEFNEMLEAQNNKCAICQVEFNATADRPYHIDHDHACCGKTKACKKCIRGILCKGCNIGLGEFKENPTTLLAAVAYLSKAVH